jgi:hypothetical protein
MAYDFYTTRGSSDRACIWSRRRSRWASVSTASRGHGRVSWHLHSGTVHGNTAWCVLGAWRRVMSSLEVLIRLKLLMVMPWRRGNAGLRVSTRSARGSHFLGFRIGAPPFFGSVMFCSRRTFFRMPHSQ